MRQSDATLVWVDATVFWVDMPFRRVHPDDHRIVQVPRADFPLQAWVDCIDLTFNGANKEDLWAVYDRMFNCHPGEKAVVHAIKCANKWLSAIGAKS